MLFDDAEELTHFSAIVCIKHFVLPSLLLVAATLLKLRSAWDGMEVRTGAQKPGSAKRKRFSSNPNPPRFFCLSPFHTFLFIDYDKMTQFRCL